MALSMRTKPIRNWFSNNSPTAPTRRVAQMVDIDDVSDILPQLQEIGDNGVEVVGIERAFFQREYRGPA